MSGVEFRHQGQVLAFVEVTVQSGITTVTGDQPNGFTVPAGETWEIQGLVTTPKNVVVAGTLRMRPGATLRFRNVNEAAFVGGDTPTPLASDVGLWMIGQGKLDALGTPKTPWTLAIGALNAGTTAFMVRDATGWQVGDEIVVTATAPRSTSDFWNRQDRRTITGLSGNVVTVAPLTNAHPATTFSGVTYTAEVLNLTRDVKIEGTPSGRAHVVYLHQGHTTFDQLSIRYVQLQHMGPRVHADAGGDLSPLILGRYALHYHHSHGTTENTVVEGCVAKDCGIGFVAHQANGVHFDRCIVHEGREAAFWWDEENVSDRVFYDRCVASSIRSPYPGGAIGFFLNKTSEPMTSKCIGCVATGIDDATDNNGFFWVNQNLGIWTFEDCLAHNMAVLGIRVWQNSDDVVNAFGFHPIDRFHAYACGVSYRESGGIDHGAYINNYHYRGNKIHDCTQKGIINRAAAGENGIRYEDVKVTGGSLPRLMVTDAPAGQHPTANPDPVLFLRCDFGHSVAFDITHQDRVDNGLWSRWDFVECNLAPADFAITAPVGLWSIRLQEATGLAWQRTHSTPWTQVPRF